MKILSSFKTSAKNVGIIQDAYNYYFDVGFVNYKPENKNQTFSIPDYGVSYKYIEKWLASKVKSGIKYSVNADKTTRKITIVASEYLSSDEGTIRNDMKFISDNQEALIQYLTKSLRKEYSGASDLINAKGIKLSDLKIKPEGTVVNMTDKGLEAKFLKLVDFIDSGKLNTEDWECRFPFIHVDEYFFGVEFEYSPVVDKPNSSELNTVVDKLNKLQFFKDLTSAGLEEPKLIKRNGTYSIIMDIGEKRIKNLTAVKTTPIYRKKALQYYNKYDKYKDKARGGAATRAGGF